MGGPTSRSPQLEGFYVVASAVALGGVAAATWFYRGSFRNNRGRRRQDLKWHIPLRNRPCSSEQESCIVYLTGIDKHTSQEEVLDYFCCVPYCVPVEVDTSEVAFARGGGRAWALYEAPQQAQQIVQRLQDVHFQQLGLCARLELGVTPNGKRIVPNNTQGTNLIRAIQPRKGDRPTNNSSKRQNKKSATKRKINQDTMINSDRNQSAAKIHVDYSHKSLFVNQTEYPFPSGLYLTRILKLLREYHFDTRSQSIALQTNSTMTGLHSGGMDRKATCLELLTDIPRMGASRYPKELSEAMAMVDALERSCKLLFSASLDDFQAATEFDSITCYCLGDGKDPVGAAALALALPESISIVSIDPLLSKDPKEQAKWSKIGISTFPGLSQDYSLLDHPSTRTHKVLSIVIACHSHAPLQEFWDRLPSSSCKLAVTMACCADYSNLSTIQPVLEYSDFEVYSPKRRIQVYYSQ